MKQGSQNVLPPETPPYVDSLDVRPTRAQAGGQVGGAQSAWTFAGSKVTPTTQRDKNHFHDIHIIDSNTQSIQGNPPSSNQEPGKLPPGSSSPGSPVTSTQGGVNGNSGNPPSGTFGANNPAPVTSSNQVVGNQGNEVPGANTPASSSSPSQAGGTPSSGTSGANSLGPVSSPNQVGGSQGKEVPGAVSLPAPNKVESSVNGGSTAGSSGTSVGSPTNPAQPNGA